MNDWKKGIKVRCRRKIINAIYLYCLLLSSSPSFQYLDECIWFSMRDNESDNLIQLLNFRRSIQAWWQQLLSSIAFHHMITANIAFKISTISIWLREYSAFYITQQLFSFSRFRIGGRANVPIQSNYFTL